MLNRVLSLAMTYRDPSCWWRNVTWRRPSTVSTLNPVFVVGAPRSGTTLLQRMLSVHPGLFSIEGETGLFSWQNLFDPSREHFGLPADQVAALQARATDVVSFFELGVRCVEGEQSGGRFVEKTPQHVLHLDFIFKHFPQASVIHILRDGRDCFCSSKSNVHIRQNTVTSFSRYWAKCVRAPWAYPEREFPILTVRYEELVRDAEDVLGKVMNFVGLALTRDQLDPLLVGKDPRANLREFSRLNQKVDASSVGRWQRELSEDEVRLFERFAGTELAHYGYEVQTD